MNKQNLVIRDFKSVLPKFKVSQAASVDRLVTMHQTGVTRAGNEDAHPLLEKLIQRYAIKDEKIAFRHFEVADILVDPADSERMWTFDAANPVANLHGADIERRTLFFNQRAQEVFAKIYPIEESKPKPREIVHVTCTGYISPSAPQRMIAERNWNTGVTHAYHMGCYAALPAVRVAEGLFLRENHDQEVHVVHTEMCGLHMDPQAHTPEQFIVQSLFSDGHIKYAVTQPLHDGKEFAILGIKEKIIADSHQDMSWLTAPWGLKMNLSAQVPRKIATELRLFLQELIEGCGLSLADVLKNGIFAVHPGGPKIIDEVKNNLELSEEQIRFSREVLKARGNMSSATLPHIWQSILETSDTRSKYVVSLAFGPGLTIFGAVFSID